MLDYTFIISETIPSIITGLGAYLIGRKKSNTHEKIEKSKLDSEIQIKALDIVKGVIQDMREEFLREITDLKQVIEKLTKENEQLKVSIQDLELQLKSSGKLTGVLQSEITSLQNMLSTYKEENDKLKNT